MTFISVQQVPNYSMIPDSCFGNDLTNHLFQDVMECADKCSSLSACVGFVFGSIHNPSCFLKHTRCPSQRPSPTVKTYYKNGR